MDHNDGSLSLRKGMMRTTAPNRASLNKISGGTWINQAFFSLCAAAFGCALVLQFPVTAIAKSNERVLHSFAGPPGDGTEPLAGVIDVNGMLYGTTMYGGSSTTCGSAGCGTVFAITPKTGAETVLYSFCSQKKCADGWEPSAGLIDGMGTLYGATSSGGANRSKECIFGDSDFCGTAFSVDPTTGAETVLHSFTSYRKDGSKPVAGLIDMKGSLYGTTLAGGSYRKNCGYFPNGYLAGCGTVFALDPETGADRVLHSFQDNGTDGYNPSASLIDVNGILYGTTITGGNNYGCGSIEGNGCGTVFSIDPKTGAETVLYSFCSQKKCADGAWPVASLLDVNDILYGTAWGGGTGNSSICRDGGCGTVFSLNPVNGEVTVLHSFCSQKQCADGSSPKAGLIDVKGTLYGTTGLGGIYRGGTLFSLDPSTGNVTVVHSFGKGKDGYGAEATLIDLKGTLYGTTAEGGAYGIGTVFALKP